MFFGGMMAKKIRTEPAGLAETEPTGTAPEAAVPETRIKRATRIDLSLLTESQRAHITAYCNAIAEERQITPAAVAQQVSRDNEMFTAALAWPLLTPDTVLEQ